MQRKLEDLIEEKFLEQASKAFVGTQHEWLKHFYVSGFKDALKEIGEYTMGRCHACGDFDFYYAPSEFPNAEKELCYECSR